MPPPRTGRRESSVGGGQRGSGTGDTPGYTPAAVEAALLNRARTGPCLKMRWGQCPKRQAKRGASRTPIMPAPSKTLPASPSTSLCCPAPPWPWHAGRARCATPVHATPPRRHAEPGASLTTAPLRPAARRRPPLPPCNNKKKKKHTARAASTHSGNRCCHEGSRPRHRDSHRRCRCYRQRRPALRRYYRRHPNASPSGRPSPSSLATAAAAVPTATVTRGPRGAQRR